MENFAQKKFAHSGFEREVFVLSSGELITATAIVQMSAPRGPRGNGVLGAEFEEE